MEKRIQIIVGHYGSGKTEVAVNYALLQNTGGKKVMLADLDIVNPYFCSREREDMLREQGIEVIIPAGGAQADLPAVSPRVFKIFDNEDITGILDVGGDPVGARVLAQYVPRIKAASYSMLMVINANRPETKTAGQIMEYIRGIEETSQLRVTGIINNTHLLNETTAEDILRGKELLEEVHHISNLPVSFHAVYEPCIPFVAEQLQEPVVAIRRYMRKPWEL